jgi:SAM-dependent methyltransferase
VLRGPDRLLGTPGRFAVHECRRCGAGLTLPRVEAGDLRLLYSGSYAPYEAAAGRLQRSISRVVQSLQGRRALRRAPLAALGAMPAGRALDVGCGRGDLGALLIRRGWQVTGVEPSEGAAATARARGLDARTGTLGDVELAPGSFDVAIFQHSLEHVPDPVADLARVHAALRAGGELLVTVPNFGSWQRRRFGSRWFHLDVPRHRVHFNREALAQALARAGFDPLELATSTSTVGLPGSVQYVLFGRCVFPGGLALRVAAGLAAGAYPLARLADRLGGEGDVLHAVARKPDR